MRRSAGVVWALLFMGCGGEVEQELIQSEEPLLVTSERRPPQGLWVRGGALPDTLAINSSTARDSAGRTYRSLDANYAVLRGTQDGWVYRNFRWEYSPIVREGTALIGTTFEGTAGVPYDLRISNVRPAAAPYSGTVYEVEYRMRGWSSWYLLCGTSALENEAIPVRGYWAASAVYTNMAGAFTFACRNGVAYKAVAWGYAPWISVPHFQAAVRAGRADYCGNGRSFTVPGTPIEIFDSAGIRPEISPPLYPEFLFEAAWAVDLSPNAPRGAVCLSKLRWEQLRPDPSVPPSPYEPGGCPGLPDPRTSPNARYCDELEDGRPRLVDYEWMRSQGALVFTKSLPR